MPRLSIRVQRFLLSVGGLAALSGWYYYSQIWIYEQPVNYEYHKQCPDPSEQYFDCDLWPK